MQNLSPSPPPPPSSSASYPLFTPHVTLSTQVSHSFSFPSLPYPSLSPEIFLPSSFSILRVTSRLHQCISQIPSLNSKGRGKGVSHIKVTRCSSSRLWCKRIGFSGRKTNIFFAFKCIAYGFAQRNIYIKYQTPDTVCWSVSIRPEPRPDKSP